VIESAPFARLIGLCVRVVPISGLVIGRMMRLLQEHRTGMLRSSLLARLSLRSSYRQLACAVLVLELFDGAHNTG
jgi:hypothetical protein